MGPGEFVTPNRDEVEQELTLLMRSSGKRNHRSKPSQLELLQGDDAPIPNKNSPGLWPAYKGPLPQTFLSPPKLGPGAGPNVAQITKGTTREH